MKKLIYVLIICSAFSNRLHAQTPYISLYSGYATGISQTSYLENYTQEYDMDANRQVTRMSETTYSLGQGLNLGGAIGLKVNENLGFELGVNFNKSKSFYGIESGDAFSDEYAYSEKYKDEISVTGTLPTTYLINEEGEIVIDKTDAADWNSAKVRSLLD